MRWDSKIRTVTAGRYVAHPLLLDSGVGTSLYYVNLAVPLENEFSIGPCRGVDVDKPRLCTVALSWLMLSEGC